MKSPEERPYRRNLAVWAALLLLLATTTGSAFVPLGVWNGIANLAIAALKALLVAVFFMHLRHAGGIVRLAAAIALFMLTLLFGLSSTDYLTRSLYSASWQVPRQLHPMPSR